MGEISDELIERQINQKPKMESAQMESEQFYGTKQKDVIKSITHDYDRFVANKGANKGKTFYKHKVIFVSGVQGTFFQLTDRLTENSIEVKEGSEICFTPHVFLNTKTQKPDPTIGDRFTFCSEEKTSTNHTETGNGKAAQAVDYGKFRGVATSYAKELIIAFYKDKPTITLDHWVEETIRVSLVLEKHLLNTNNT